ncbi:protein mono-ADP-ribosyltransferase PARP12-like [Branchiostoma lanceolatum]|uniref:protein mono-ADP-ribosyltransferase PARP12-like n=1 Tax=Branchiostoma lanceolatum TaxID=7740 RepID=UPI00345377D5
MYSDYSDSETESVTSQASSNVGGNKKGRGRRKPSQGNMTKAQQSAVKDFILQRGGTVSHSELRQQSFYPETDEDVEEWLRDEPGRYLVKRNIKGKVQSVSAIVKVRLCYDFTNSRCKFGNGCTNLHICKEFLEGTCNRGETCKFPHHFQGEQNRKVVKGMGLDGLSDDEIVKVIRGSLPKSCKFYNSTNGCRDNTLCTNLHICNNYIRESCKGDCKLSHNFAEPHNGKVLRRHLMGSNMPEHILQYCTMLFLSPATKRSEAVVPVSRGRGRGRGRGGRGAANRARSTENLSLASAGASTESLENAGRRERGRGRGRSSGGRGRRGSCGRRMAEDGSPATEVERAAIIAPSETYIFKLICCQYNGKAMLDSLWHMEFCTLGLDQTQTTSWFRKHPNKFRLHETTDGKLEVYVILPKARLCFGHTMKSGCQKGDQCQFFHLCRNFIQGSCNHGPRCKFVHDLESEQARKLVHELQLDCLTDDQIFNVIRNSAPKVCEAYNTHSCLKADRCPDIHICSEFVRGRCADDTTCDLNHESYFDTPQTRRILSDYRMANTDQRVVIKTILIPPTTAAVVRRPPVPRTSQATCTATKKPVANIATTSTPTTLQPNAPPPVPVVKTKATSTPTTVGQPNTSPPGQTVKPKAKAPDPNEERILDSDRTICEDFLAGQCLKSRLCGHHHIKTPYLWQYQDLKNASGSQGGEWVSFSPEVVAKIEEVFSQPSNISCNLRDIETRLDGWTVHFDKMVLEISDSYPSKRVRIRRLSTPSSVESTSGASSTKWVWYFENNNSWCPYGQSVKSGTSAFITSDDIERAYVTKQPTYKFLTNEFPYTLDFTGMYQLNMDPRYSTKRNVRRRPTYVPFHSSSNTRTHLTASQPSSVTRGSLPPTWKPMPQKEAFKRVSLAPTDAEFREVEKLFRQTMMEDMIILQIERVQNPHLWKKYSMNKQLMMQKSLESRYGRTHYDERKLFHGTDPDITKGICHQNFDFRLSGENATVYGKGSYFAKEASYSHRYSKASPDGTRYMFLANVLVGMYTTGKQNIPRPPPIDPSDPYGDLYDSCVDNKDNPSIFVVFKDDQCYPAYLIKYANQNDLAAIDHDMLDPLGGYPFSYSSRQVQGPSTPSRSSNVRAGSSSSTSYSTYGRQGTPTSSPTRQSATTSYASYGVQSQSPAYPASRYTSSASYQTYRANIPSPPPSQQSNSSSGSTQKTNCSIQ